MLHVWPMHALDQLDELMVCRLGKGRSTPAPCTIVILGASGDLTSRKLVPALFHLHRERLLPPQTRVIGVARRDKTDTSWRDELYDALLRHSRTKPVDAVEWQQFAPKLSYCRGDITDPAAYARLAIQIAEAKDEQARHNRLFYLAVSPSQVADAVTMLTQNRLFERDVLIPAWQRIVVEKPFGHDRYSAERLNVELGRHAHEQQLLRIDHYLGKETVQNLLMFRFSNAIFEPLWSRQAVDHVQITVSEKNGVGDRGGYYEEAGASRDMAQNHLLQVLALATMEPPVSLEAESIRDEKVKLLKSIRPVHPDNVVRGQYSAGSIDGVPCPAYRQEPKVKTNSNVETFLALKVLIDNWRWSGVPFYLRTGKRLPLNASEVRIQFHQTPHVLFSAHCGPTLDANALTLRLQPQEGISLRFNGKVPGATTAVRPVRMNFSYDTEFGAYTPEAYERLLLDAIEGDSTLFIRRDEVDIAWAIVDNMRSGWKDRPLAEPDFYAAGTWGPAAANALVEPSKQPWRNPQPVP